MNKKDFVIEPPKMSWDKPIIEETLDYVRHMKRSWIGNNSIWPHVRRARETYIDAFDQVEKHILREMAFREKIKK